MRQATDGAHLNPLDAAGSLVMGDGRRLLVQAVSCAAQAALACDARSWRQGLTVHPEVSETVLALFAQTPMQSHVQTSLEPSRGVTAEALPLSSTHDPLPSAAAWRLRGHPMAQSLARGRRPPGPSSCCLSDVADDACWTTARPSPRIIPRRRITSGPIGEAADLAQSQRCRGRPSLLPRPLPRTSRYAREDALVDPCSARGRRAHRPSTRTVSSGQMPGVRGPRDDER